MNVEQIKNLYNISRVLILGIFIVAIIVKIYKHNESESIILLFVSGILVLINLFQYKSILRNEVIHSESMYLIATNVVFVMGNILYVFFGLGRYFVKYWY